MLWASALDAAVALMEKNPASRSGQQQEPSSAGSEITIVKTEARMPLVSPLVLAKRSGIWQVPVLQSPPFCRKELELELSQLTGYTVWRGCAVRKDACRTHIRPAREVIHIARINQETETSNLSFHQGLEALNVARLLPHDVNRLVVSVSMRSSTRLLIYYYAEVKDAASLLLICIVRTERLCRVSYVRER